MKISAKSFAFILALSSGAASFAYWLAWMRRLIFLFGESSIVSAALALLFILGLDVGMLIWRRAANLNARANFYAIAGLAAATCACDFASVPIFHAIEYLYLRDAWWPSHRILFFTAGLAIAVLVVLPPAVLAGALLRSVTLAAASQITAFAATAAGAAFATPLTCALLAYIGPASTVFGTATVNAVLAAAAFSAAKSAWAQGNASNAPISDNSASLTTQLRSPEASSSEINRVLWVVCVGSGFALAAFGITCGRLLALLFGPLFYVQGALLAVILSGIAIGIVLDGHIGRIARGGEQLLGVSTFLFGLAMALSNFILSQLPLVGDRLFDLLRRSFGGQITALLTIAILAELVPSIAFGVTFSAALGTFKNSRLSPGEPILPTSVRYSTGLAIGICLTEFVFFPLIGLRGAVTASVFTAIVAGAASWRIGGLRQRRQSALLVAIAAVSFVLMLPAIPAGLFAKSVRGIGPALDAGVTPREMLRRTQLIYYRDGRNASIAIERTAQAVFLSSNGEPKGSTNAVDAASQLWMGHLPMLLHPRVRNSLILGLGTGITAAALSRYPLEQIDVVESEPATIQAPRFFNPYTRDVLNDPRVHFLFGTPQSYVMLTPKRYDVIISDLNRPWSSTNGPLMTVEFYRLISDRLNEGGVFVQSLGTAGVLPADLQVVAATFHHLFPHMQIWTSPAGHWIFVGTREVVAWDYSALNKRFTETKGVADDLTSIGIWSPFSIFGAQVLGEADAAAFTRSVGRLYTGDGLTLDLRAARSRYEETTSQTRRELNLFRRPGPPEIAGFHPDRDLDAEGAYLLGFAYASMGQSDLAIRYMERSTRMAPDHPTFWVGLANQYRAVGRATEARTAYEHALATDLNNVEALISLGEIRMEEGRLDWTRVLAERALRLAPQDPRAHALMNRLAESQP